MVKTINIGKFKSTWVLKHRWEKDKSITNWETRQLRKNLQLGIWCKIEKAVGPTKKGKNTEDTVRKTFNKSNLVNCYIVGFNLIVCKAWVNFSFKPTMNLKID
jgi:hypothetical protein